MTAWDDIDTAPAPEELFNPAAPNDPDDPDQFAADEPGTEFDVVVGGHSLMLRAVKARILDNETALPTTIANSIATALAPPLILTPAAPATVPLTLKGAAAQSVSHLEVRNSANTLLMRVDTGGNVCAPFVYSTGGGGANLQMLGSGNAVQVNSGGAANRALVIRGATSQTANLIEAQTSGGTANFVVGPTGQAYAYAGLVAGGNQGSGAYQAAFRVTPATAANKALVIKSFAAQSANLFEVLDSADTLLASVPAGGTPTATTDLMRKGDADARAAVTQVFTSSGTWTKPAGAKSVSVTVISGGGGGGAGRRGAPGTLRGGGGGGGSGAVIKEQFDASLLGATEAVTVGTGGVGGPAQTVNDTDGANGGIGNFSQFYQARVSGGTNGLGGTAAAGGAGGAGAPGAVNGGTGSNGGAAGSTGANALTGTASGGGGGGISAANTAQNGGLSYTCCFRPAYTSVLGGIAPGGAGAVGITYTPPGPGSGGGGGGAAADGTTPGGAGGSATNYGCAGGGGGASTNGANSGKGGDGSPGVVIVTTYF